MLQLTNFRILILYLLPASAYLCFEIQNKKFSELSHKKIYLIYK